LTSSFQDDLVNRYTDTVYCIIRVVVGLMFACHGGQKILGFPPSERGLATNPLGVTVGWIELSCGFLVAFGLLTRPAAFTASGEMAVAYFLTSFLGKNARSRAERPGAVVADPEQGRAAGAILFHVFPGSILRPGSLEH
jgi:uncharacterized membrane protein YphA (DoxX/SURF4 family)